MTEENNRYKNKVKYIVTKAKNTYYEELLKKFKNNIKIFGNYRKFNF